MRNIKENSERTEFSTSPYAPTMFTFLLVVVAIALLLAAFVCFSLGKRMTAERLDELTEAIEDYVDRRKRIVATRDERSLIYFSDTFAEEVGLTNLLFIASGKGGFVARWANGRTSHYVPKELEECEALLRFVKAMQKGFPNGGTDLDKAAGTDQIKESMAEEAGKEKETNVEPEA